MTTALGKLPLDKGHNANDALIDQLRACKSTKEILEFELWFNTEANAGQLYKVICNLLRDRSISRVTASKWFEVLLMDRESKLSNNT